MSLGWSCSRQRLPQRVGAPGIKETQVECVNAGSCRGYQTTFYSRGCFPHEYNGWRRERKGTVDRGPFENQHPFIYESALGAVRGAAAIAGSQARDPSLALFWCVVCFMGCFFFFSYIEYSC